MEKCLHRIAEKLSKFLIQNGVADDEMHEWYSYAFYSGIMLAGNFFISLVLAAAFGVIPESIVCMGLLFFIRSYCGGFHCQGVFSCAVISNAILLGMSFWVHGSAEYYNIVFFIVQIFCGVVLALIGPVQTKNKVLKKERENRAEKNLIRNLLFINTVSVVLWLKGYQMLPMAVFTVHMPILALVFIQMVINGREGN